METDSPIQTSSPHRATTSRLPNPSIGDTEPGERHLRAVELPSPDDAGADLGDLTNSQISERVAGLAGRIAAATCEWLGYVAEADRRGIWSGFVSCAAWMSWRCGIGLGTAADHIRVAHAVQDLPIIRAHFAAGSLSYSQVRALIRGVGLVPEAELVELARHATGSQLERLIRALRRAATDDEEDAAAARQRAHWHVDDDGSLVISARLSGEWAEAWLAAIEQAQAQAHAQEGGTVSQAAVMATVAGRALSAPPDSSAPTPTVSIIADLDALTAATDLVDRGSLELTDPNRSAKRADRLSAESPTGVALADSAPDSAQSQRETTDDSAGVPAEAQPQTPAPSIHWGTTGAPASIITLAALLHHAQIELIARLVDGTLIDLGRARRRPSARLARTVLRRHGGRCAHPHCRARAHLHLHHVVHWVHGGATSAANLIPLCGRHHRALHKGEFQVTVEVAGTSVATDSEAISAGSFRFHSPQGRPLAAVASTVAIGTPLSVDTEYADAEVNGQAIIEMNNRAERLHLDYAVMAILEGHNDAPASA